MRRIVPLLVAVISLAPACGCGGLGWYQAVGHLPGIAHTDYAFYDFCDTSSQLFQFPAYKVETALIEALADLGFKVTEPPGHDPDRETWIHAKTPDGRPAKIRLTPQNAMTNVRVSIGPVHVGDEALSHELLRRVALNFGTVMRTYNPVEPTLSRRINEWRGLPPQVQSPPPEPLEGDGLRPTGKGDQPADEDAIPIPAEDMPATTIPGQFPNFVPTRDFPNPPTIPYAPFPYTPYNAVPPY
jgi:hypothetical protein